MIEVHFVTNVTFQGLFLSLWDVAKKVVNLEVLLSSSLIVTNVAHKLACEMDAFPMRSQVGLVVKFRVTIVTLIALLLRMAHALKVAFQVPSCLEEHAALVTWVQGGNNRRHGVCVTLFLV